MMPVLGRCYKNEENPEEAPEEPVEPSEPIPEDHHSESRGKLIDINYDAKGILRGACIHTLLLEKVGIGRETKKKCSAPTTDERAIKRRYKVYKMTAIQEENHDKLQYQTYQASNLELF
ncbi:hypothetical protein L1987_40083 [Smallanthus sonchifolius]|uniref:Uncharacterized protein n=1 Tax=Smallanthus sonchifolius TaxID=185202 RepID=A0ACB9GTC2_9ASTR|nr:hypothetical protein L1987_40083 [Smallanthus sonchifolius]